MGQVSAFPPYPFFNADLAIPVIDNLPQFTVGGSLRMLNAAIFAQIQTDYADAGLVNGILFGVSPATLMARYGVDWTDNPSASDYNNVSPTGGRLFTYSATPSIGQVLGQAVSSSADGVQTVSGVDFTDPNGQNFTTVTWCWGYEVALYTTADGTNRWDQEVVSYTGDGTSGRLIPTSFALDEGKVAIWIFPQTADQPAFRNNDMTGTVMCSSPICTTGGIMAFQSGGFTVTNDAGPAALVNTLAKKYTALVFKCSDTTTPYMSFGSYPGRGAIATTGTFVAGSNLAVIGGMSAQDIGRPITINGVQVVTVNAVSGSNITLSAQSQASGALPVTAPAGGQTIETENAVTAPSQIWVFGRQSQCAFWTDDMPTNQSTSFGNEGKALTDQITSVALGSFVPGADNNVNSSSLTYYWVAFHFGASDEVRTKFHTFKATGTGSNVAKTGFGFAPGFATARRFTAADVAGSVWRGPQHLTTHATRFDGIDDSPSGIVSLDADGLTVGVTVAPNLADCYGFAVKSSATVSSFTEPTWVATTDITNPDGTTSAIQTIVQSQTSPGDGYTLTEDAVPTFQWWCNADLGYAVYQIDSPGSGWVACVGPASDNGWYQSATGFGATSVVVSGGTPADPRPWSKIATWAANYTGMLGGSPGAAAATGKNSFVYPASGYTVGTDYPPIRIFNGRSDKELCRLPPTTANVIPKAVMSMLAANGTVYLTSWDSGTTSADWAGRVFQLDTDTGILTVLGTVFAAGEMPYALAWHMGRLWCGTNNGIGTVGKVYYFRPGIDTAWTLDYTTSTSTAGGVDSMVSYKGKLYVGTDNAAASRGKVLVRDTAGAYTTSQSGAGGTARVNNGYLQLTVFGTNLYASYWNPDAPGISKIEKFDGATWSAAYSSISQPFIQLVVDDGVLYAFSGGNFLPAAIISSVNGTSWTDMTDELPETDTTLLPMFGAVVV